MRLEQLDEETQRRLILQAAKFISPDKFRDLRNEPPTAAELDSELNQYFWVCLLAGFCLVFPWIILPFACAPLWKLRSHARRLAERWPVAIDTDVTHYALAADIRRMLKTLPKSQRGQVKHVSKELSRMSEHWSDLQRKLQRLAGVESTATAAEVEIRAMELQDRIGREADPVTLASLQRQLEMLAGQRDATKNLDVWRTRLTAAQEECTQSLLHLRSRLTLLATAGDLRETAAVSEAAQTIEALNSRLAATQDAAEEVMRLGVSA